MKYKVNKFYASPQTLFTANPPGESKSFPIPSCVSLIIRNALGSIVITRSFNLASSEGRILLKLFLLNLGRDQFDVAGYLVIVARNFPFVTVDKHDI